MPGASCCAEQADGTDRPMKPQMVAHELDRLLAADAIVATDSGTNTFWAARYLTDPRGHDVLLLGHAGQHGLRPALRDGGGGRLSRTGRWSPSSATAGSPC